MMKHSFGEFHQKSKEKQRLRALRSAAQAREALPDIECIHEQPTLIANYA